MRKRKGNEERKEKKKDQSKKRPKSIPSNPPKEKETAPNDSNTVKLDRFLQLADGIPIFSFDLLRIIEEYAMPKPTTELLAMYKDVKPAEVPIIFLLTKPISFDRIECDAKTVTGLLVIPGNLHTLRANLPITSYVAHTYAHAFPRWRFYMYNQQSRYSEHCISSGTWCKHDIDRNLAIVATLYDYAPDHFIYIRPHKALTKKSWPVFYPHFLPDQQQQQQ